MPPVPPIVIAPDSSRPGLLRPAAASGGNAPADIFAGQSLDNFMQQVVAVCAGIDFTLVRPRWQPEPPNEPDRNVDFATIAVTTTTPLGYPHMVVRDGYVDQYDQEEFTVFCSFFGPNADRRATQLRSGLMLAQNREIFQLNGMGLVQTTGRTRLPDLRKNVYLERIDISFTMRREVRENYPVLAYAGDEVRLTTDTGYATDQTEVIP